MTAFNRNPQYSASIALIFGGVLWGLFWIPMRFLEDLGLHGAWAGLVVYVGGSIGVVLLMLLGQFRIRKLSLDLVICGLLTGSAFSLYALSLAFTEVVRAILLFYLTPIWGTLLGRAFLGERFTVNRLLALGLAFVGLLVVLGIGANLPVPQNLGDWLALTSGVFWALGTMRIYQMGDVPVFDQTAAFLGGALVVTLVAMLCWPAALTAGVPVGEVVGQMHWGLVMTAYILPMLFLTIWPASLLTPGRVGVLLMSEVFVGVFSAGMFAGETFGWREGLGAALIVSAALVEVLGKTPQPSEAA